MALSPSHCGGWVAFFSNCISRFPAFAENDGMGNGNDRLGCLPCTFVTQQTFVTVAHSPSSPLLRKRRKAGVHSWLNVFLDSLLSQRMTKRETGMTEWVLSPHLRHRRGSLFIFCFSGTARQRSAGGFVWFNHVKASKHATPCVDILPATITPDHRLTKLFIKSITEGFQLFSTRF